MPQADHLGAHLPRRARGVDVVERAGKRDDTDARRHCGSRLIVQSSITVLANSDSAISASVVSSTVSSTSSSNLLP
ncbi:Uncharacterised protein [Mycobacterium tuberculosis]|nr:Uncharacterised protein [Mycobacterium tuberculosis]CPA45887.1 Uncharacterised protein [Mycobacterium tuberculosis]